MVNLHINISIVNYCVRMKNNLWNFIHFLFQNGWIPSHRVGIKAVFKNLPQGLVVDLKTLIILFRSFFLSFLVLTRVPVIFATIIICSWSKIMSQTIVVEDQDQPRHCHVWTLALKAFSSIQLLGQASIWIKLLLFIGRPI